MNKIKQFFIRLNNNIHTDILCKLNIHVYTFGHYGYYNYEGSWECEYCGYELEDYSKRIPFLSRLKT